MSRYEQLSVGELTTTAPSKVTTGVGVKNTTTAVLNSAMSIEERGNDVMHKTIITCTNLNISVADDAAVAQYGGVLVYTFPKGLITTFGARISGNLGVVSGTIIAAFTGVNALGSIVATTGATLVSTEATWLQSTANATASASVAAISSFSIATDLTETGGRTYNGTSTAGPVFLNVAIADDASHTAAVLYFTGTITLLWSLVSA